MGTQMNVEVITSFNQKYYDIIGKDAVKSWLELWPTDMTLTCYVEEMSLPDHPRIKQVSFDQLPQGYRDFQLREVKNRVHIFSKKAWSFIHAMFNSDADRIMWIDSDVITQQPVSRSLLESVMPESVLSTHLGVRYKDAKDGRSGDWLVPETGVFVINCRHPDFEKFRNEYQRRYVENDSQELRRFYDNDVYGAALTKIGSPCLDLCKDLAKPYKTPLKHTVLGPYLHHYKAKHSKDWFNQERQ